MSRALQRRLVCTAKVCRKNCASWESGARAASRLKKSSPLVLVVREEREWRDFRVPETRCARIRVGGGREHAFWARQSAGGNRWQPHGPAYARTAGDCGDGWCNLVAAPGKYSNLGLSTLTDRWPGEGPLGGIITALRANEKTRNGAEWNLLVGCDMPFLTLEWLSYLVERSLVSRAEVVVPRSANGLEPLCACWRSSGTRKLQRAFDDGVRKVTEAMKQLQMEIIDESDWKRFDSAGRLFWNMNTAADYDEAKKILEAERV